MDTDFFSSPCQPLSEVHATCSPPHCLRDQKKEPHSLASRCCRGRMRVCGVRGDRNTCARMAQLGFFPGSELELVCRVGEEQCTVRINGSAISLDGPSAASILVTPL